MFKKVALSLQPLSLLNGGNKVLRKKFKIFSKKIWKFEKVALPLQPLSASKIGENQRYQLGFGLEIQFRSLRYLSS